MVDRKPNTKKLTSKQKRFCREYIFDWNATRSYTVAYPGIKNTGTAKAAASRLLTNVNVKAYITDIQNNLEEIAGVSKLMIISEHKKLAFSSIAHLHNTWVTRKEFEDLTDDQKSCIAEISTQIKVQRDVSGELTENEYVKIKLYDKQKSLVEMSKLCGFDAPIRTELTGKDGKPLVTSIRIEIINSATQVKKDDSGS
jgi:phage terminase small subunit